MAAANRVLVIGGTTFDHIVYLQQLPAGTPTTIHQCRFAEMPGSTGTAKAVALQQLQVPVHLISACGDDVYGGHIKNYLDSTALSYQLFTDPAGTERHVNLMDAEGKRISIFITNSSDTIALPPGYLQQHLQQHDIIVLNIIAYCRPWANEVAQCGKPVFTDLHDYDGHNSYHQPFIDAAQYIFLSSDNLGDYKTVMQRFIAAGKLLVVCTHGRQGASLLSAGGECIEMPALNVPLVDSNGAGDNFFAGFLYGWLRQQPLHDCMLMATRAAAACVQASQIVSAALNPQLL